MKMSLETRPTLRAAIGLALLAPPTHAQQPGADSPEVLFDSVREAALAQDWTRFRALLDRPAFQQELDAFREIVARTPADPETVELLDEIGFDSAEELAVPELADWCIVDVIDGGRLAEPIVAHVDPEMVELVRDWRRRSARLTSPSSRTTSVSDFQTEWRA